MHTIFITRITKIKIIRTILSFMMEYKNDGFEFSFFMYLSFLTNFSFIKRISSLSNHLTSFEDAHYIFFLVHCKTGQLI
jgi:hypothetical protein